MAFVRVAGTDEIPPGRGTLVEGDGFAVAVFNVGGGRFHAVSAVCPHEDGPLADGWVEREAAVCPWHGFDFDLRTGQCLVDPELRVPVYSTRVAGTGVEVDLP